MRLGDYLRGPLRGRLCTKQFSWFAIDLQVKPCFRDLPTTLRDIWGKKNERPEQASCPGCSKWQVGWLPTDGKSSCDLMSAAQYPKSPRCSCVGPLLIQTFLNIEVALIFCWAFPHSHRLTAIISTLFLISISIALRNTRKLNICNIMG